MDRKPPESPSTGAPFQPRVDQRLAVERWERAGWIFLHWTEVPRTVAVLQNAIGDVVFIGPYGKAWKGPRFSKAKPVPLEQYPPAVPEELPVS